MKHNSVLGDVLKVTVSNVLGKVVLRKELSSTGNNSWELDLGKQPSGNYTVEIVNGKERVLKKIVVH